MRPYNNNYEISFYSESLGWMAIGNAVSLGMAKTMAKAITGGRFNLVIVTDMETGEILAEYSAKEVG